MQTGATLLVVVDGHMCIVLDIFIYVPLQKEEGGVSRYLHLNGSSLCIAVLLEEQDCES